MIKAIVFDYGGVAGTNVMPFIHERVARRAKLPVETVKAEYYKLRPAIQKGEMSIHMFWLKYGEAIDLDSTIVEEIWDSTFKEKAKRNEEVREIVRLLKNGGYKIALCSNTIPPHIEFHRRNGDFDIFPVQILSCEIGMRKPDEEIYEYTLKQLDVEADECIFIDDKLENVEGAKKVGIKAIFFKDVKQLKKELKKCGVHGL